MPLRVGTTSGIYMAARAAELANAIKKLGYVLTRGADCMELPADVAHEVPYSHGVQIRHMAKKQGVTINFHGDLATPFEMPDRGEWRDAHDRVIKSLRSAIFVGAGYIDFHASLNIWLELMTYAGRKLTLTFCDHNGRFISEILQKNKKLRDWFTEERGDSYLNDILKRDERTKLNTNIQSTEEKWYKQEMDTRLKKALTQPKIYSIIEKIAEANSKAEEKKVTPDKIIADLIDAAELRGRARTGVPEIDGAIENTMEELRTARTFENAAIQKQEVDKAIKEKMAKSGKDGDWDSEELRAVVGIVDGYHIMAHYLFYTKDPQWLAMVEEYKDVVVDKYGLDYNDPYWLDKTWKKAETENDKNFKEFFYAVVSAKFLEGHMKAAFDWLRNVFIKEEIPDIVKGIKDPKEQEKEKEELTRIAKNLIIGIENPDARSSEHAGMYPLWRPRQIYSAVKTLRSVLKTDKVMIIVDHEHLATNGVDALQESRKYIKTKPDFGELVISVHANHPNPLHPHEPIELGDTILYELIYNLRLTGLGVKRTAFLIFERGGGEDPFQKSIDSLRLMVQFLEKSPPTPTDSLPLEFYGLQGMSGDAQRQLMIIRDHTMDPIKDLLEVPEEEWSFLSKAAREKGRAEAFKKGEYK